MIAANNVATDGQGFNSNNNALCVYSHNTKTDIPLGSKVEIAKQLVSLIHQQQS